MKRKPYIFIFLIYTLPSNGMFSTTARRIGTSSLPTQTRVPWYQQIKRRFHTFTELLAFKNPQEVKTSVQKARQAYRNIPPTLAHLYTVSGPIFEKIVSRFNLDVQQLDTILAQEKEYFNKGYNVFYHSTQPKIHALNYIATRLIELIAKVQQQPLPAKTPFLLRQSADTKAVSETIRQDFLEKGSQNDHWDKNYLLSCNPAIISNLSSDGECTLTFWAYKVNIDEEYNLDKQLELIISQAEKTLNYLIDKDRIKNAILKLEKLTTGVLLQLVFKNKELLEQCTYVSEPYGIKRHVCNIVNQTELTSPHQIMELYSKSPESFSPDDIDDIQYRLILTQDKLLDVLNKDIADNFEIKTYANPQSILDAFHTEIDTIMTEIEQTLTKKSHSTSTKPIKIKQNLPVSSQQNPQLPQQLSRFAQIKAYLKNFLFKK